MANILNILERSIIKGETVVLPDGRTVSPEAFRKSLTSEYLAKVKSGEAEHLSLTEYADTVAPGYMTTGELLDAIRDAINPAPNAEPEDTEPDTPESNAAEKTTAEPADSDRDEYPETLTKAEPKPTAVFTEYGEIPEEHADDC